MTWLDTARAHDLHQPVVLPERFKDATLDGLPESELKRTTERYARAFWAEAARGIAPLFIGRTREWKTYAACVLARLANRFITVDFLPAGRLSLHRLQRFNHQADQLARWQRVPLLVVDDAFLQPEPERLLLTTVFLARFEACRPTIITGNLLLEPGAEWHEIERLYSAAFARRLEDASAGYRVLLM